MEETIHFESILKSLRKPQHGKRLLQILVALRKQVNGPNIKLKINIIKENNCLKSLIGFTQHDSNSKVVDLALSILGNCCTCESVVRISITDFNILYNLSSVLKKHKKDSIKGRVFRILGNLCDAYAPLQLIEKEPAIINNTINFLKQFGENGVLDNGIVETSKSNQRCHSSVATISMALRFIRKLLHQDTFTILADTHHIVQTIGLLLIKCTNELKNNNDNYNLIINDVIKLLQIISSSMYRKYDIIAELKCTEAGDSLESLKDIILLHPEKIVKIILKLSHFQKNQSDLPIEEIITNLLQSVHAEPEKSNKIQGEYLQCINKIMDIIGFHDKLRTSNSISLLVKLLKEFKCNTDFEIHCCMLICSILIKCKYNDDLIKSQINADIITIIIEKLELIAGCSSETIELDIHEKRHANCISPNKNKRSKANPSNRESTGRLHQNTMQFHPMNFKPMHYSYEERSASPSSSSSEVSSNGPYSPRPCNEKMLNESDSDNYSPLCSENESDDEQGFKSRSNDDIVLSETEIPTPTLSQSQVKLRDTLKSDMFDLLKCYCQLGSPLYKQLGNPKLLTILINLSFLDPTKPDIAMYIIDKIVKNTEFFIKLMLYGMISNVYEIEVTNHDDDCMECDIVRSKADKILTLFQRAAETESIHGDIAYSLGKANNEVKTRLVLAIPYVIHKKYSLRQLMLKFGGLSILLNLLRDRSNIDLQSKCIKSLCILATYSLKIKTPVEFDRHKRKNKIKVGIYELADCDNVVSFKLDDDHIINADRTSLNEQSDYFSTLLSSERFIESGQNEITLKNVPSASLNCLLRLLQLNVKSSHTLDIDYDIETVLNCILISDRFLLHDLGYILTCHVEQLLTTTTVPIIYKWSLESATNIMRVESLAFALAADIPYNERLDMFYALFNLGYFENLLDDFEKLIKQFL